MLQYSNIDPDSLKAALNATAEKRGSIGVIVDYRDIINTVKSSEIMRRQWYNYQRDFEYAEEILFEEACDTVVELMDRLSII